MQHLAVMLKLGGVIWVLLLILILSFILTVICQNHNIVFSMTEEAQTGTYVGEVLEKTDLSRKYHESDLKQMRFYFMNPTDAGVNFFSINPVRGEIHTSHVIDRDTLCDVVSTCCFESEGCFISLIVGVTPRQFFSVYNVRVDIKDINDNNPIFPENTISINMAESSPINKTYLIQMARDLDIGKNGIQRYAIQSPKNIFGIKEIRVDSDIIDVAIMNMKELDRETQSLYGIKVFAIDGGKPRRTGTLAVNVIVTDVNDNSPTFRNSGYTVSVRENVAVNSSILQIKADDPDVGKSSKVRYTISRRASNKVQSTFGIEPTTGWITVKRRLDYEGTKIYQVPIEARDMGPDSRPSRTTVAVHVIDVNDNSPTIHVTILSRSGKAEIRESENPGEVVAHILIQDVDSGVNGHVSCSVDNSYFLLIKEVNISNQDVYRLETAAPLNRETTPEYRITVACQDMGDPKLESRETFTVMLLDINDNSPAFSKRTYTASIEENNNLGVFLLQVHANDQDDGRDGKVSYEIGPDGKGLVTVNQEGKIYASTVFDREQYDEIVFHVVAEDGGDEPLSTTATVILKISDQNDNTPFFLDDYTFEISENDLPHVPIGTVEAKDNDRGRNKELHFALADSHDSAYFEVTSDGTILTKRRLDREHKPDYQLNVLAVDHGEPPLTSATQVKIRITDINDNSPVIKFPISKNNTVYISYLVNVAQPFTKIEAEDADMGMNGEILYYIKHGNEMGFFAMNERTGVLMINKPMNIDDAHVYKLKVEVRDRGTPSHRSVETLTIVVDGTGKPISLSGNYIEKKPSNKNLIIVICLASVSGMLAIVLIVAIVCIRKKDTIGHTYNIKTETQRIFNNKRHSPSFSRNSVEEPKSPSPTPKKEVSFSTENDDIPELNHSTFKGTRMQPSWGTNSSLTYEPTKICRSSTLNGRTQERQSMYDTSQSFPSSICDMKYHQVRPKALIDLYETGSQVSLNHSLKRNNHLGCVQDTMDSGRGSSITGTIDKHKESSTEDLSRYIIDKSLYHSQRTGKDNVDPCCNYDEKQMYKLQHGVNDNPLFTDI